MADYNPFVDLGDEHDALASPDRMVDPITGNPYMIAGNPQGVVFHYATLAAAIADTANLVNGQYVFIAGGDEFAAGFTNADRGIWRVDSNQGAANTDYTKVLDITDHGSELELADAGNFFATDNAESALQEIGGKQVIYKRASTSLSNITVNGGSTTAFDTALKALVLDNGSFTDAVGAGSSTVNGILLNSTIAHQLPIRNHNTRDSIDDGSGNIVYGRLTQNAGNYVLTFYSWVSGVETPYSFGANTAIDLSHVYASMDFMKLPATVGINDASFFGDDAGLTGTIDDSQVVTNSPAFTDLLSGLATQEAVNNKVDDLGSDANGEGASLIAVETGGNFTATDVQGALDELFTLINTYENIHYAANLAAAYALAASDQDWSLGDLVVIEGDTGNESERGLYEITANTGTFPGDAAGDYTKRLDISHTAAEVLIADAGSYFTGTQVEAGLDELAAAIGGTDSVTRDYSSNNYVADNDDIVTAIGKLDAALSNLDADKITTSVFVADGAVNAGTTPQLVSYGTAALDATLTDVSSTTANNHLRVLGFATGANYADGVTIDQGDGVVMSGLLGGFSGLSAGSVYYADPSTPGGITSTKPTGVNETAIEVGRAVSATQLVVNIQEALAATHQRQTERKIFFRSSAGTVGGLGETGLVLRPGDIWIDDDTSVQNPTKSGTGRYTMYVCIQTWTGAGVAVAQSDIVGGSRSFVPIGRQN